MITDLDFLWVLVKIDGENENESSFEGKYFYPSCRYVLGDILSVMSISDGTWGSCQFADEFAADYRRFCIDLVGLYDGQVKAERHFKV